jgi:hypothetical protein
MTEYIQISHGWKYTIYNVEYQPEIPAIRRADPLDSDPPEPEDIQFQWVRVEDTSGFYDDKPDYNHNPQWDDEFCAELIEQVTGVVR